jgi:hypothetical protein
MWTDGERCLGALLGTGGHSGMAVDNTRRVNHAGTIENPTEKAGYPSGQGFVGPADIAKPFDSRLSNNQLSIINKKNGEGGIRTGLSL